MSKPLKEYIFRPVDGVWQNVSGESETLAECLQRLGVIVDDKAEFVRFRDVRNHISIWYRAHALKVVITIWPLS